MYQAEFERIWAARAPHHKLLTEELKARLFRAIFCQRPLQSPKGPIGKCELEAGQRRAPWALLLVQRYRYWQKIADLEITDPEGEIRKLTPDERDELAEAFETHQEMTFGGIRKLLGLEKPKAAEHGYEFNLEAGGEKKLIGNRTAAVMAKGNLNPASATIAGIHGSASQRGPDGGGNPGSRTSHEPEA